MRGNTAIGERWMGTAPKELATVMRSMKGTIAMGDETIMKTAFVEIPIVKMSMMVVKDDK
jgi:hypothetical protein